MDNTRAEKARAIIKKARDEDRQVLTEFEAKQILSLYDIPVTREMLVNSAEEAVAAFNTLIKPVAMKIVSPDIIHKTEANCVKLNLREEGEIRKSYQEILGNAKSYCESASIKGLLLQEMALEGIEVIVGTSYDTTFGPVLMFGLGGIFVETIRDVAFRAIPITMADAEEMVEDIKGYAILKGVRGKKGVWFEKLYETLMSVSTLVCENEVVKEIDINPLFVNDKGATAADVRMILSNAK